MKIKMKSNSERKFGSDWVVCFVFCESPGFGACGVTGPGVYVGRLNRINAA